MILIIGPAFSGKKEYAHRLRMKMNEKIYRRNAGCISGHIRKNNDSVSGSAHGQNRGNPERIFSEADKSGGILTEVQDLVSEEMDMAALQVLADELCAGLMILTASETGAGIVPVEGELRRRREMQGRLLSILAQHADCVVRVYYGLPEIIKGELSV